MDNPVEVVMGQIELFQTIPLKESSRDGRSEPVSGDVDILNDRVLCEHVVGEGPAVGIGGEVQEGEVSKRPDALRHSAER
jgi:hypothetical protein